MDKISSEMSELKQEVQNNLHSYRQEIKNNMVDLRTPDSLIAEDQLAL